MIFRITPAQKATTLATRIRFSHRGRHSARGGVDLVLPVSWVVILKDLPIDIDVARRGLPQ